MAFFALYGNESIRNDGIEQQRYRYQWMDVQQPQLKKRWDNGGVGSGEWGGWNRLCYLLISREFLRIQPDEGLKPCIVLTWGS